MKAISAALSVLLPACAALAAGQAPPPLPKGLAPATIENLDTGEAYKVQVELPELRERGPRGDADFLSAELFFDTYEEKKDVRPLTEPIEKMAAGNGGIHRPPIVMFIWGNSKFQGEIETARVRYTLFLPDGTPCRATVNIKIKEAGTAKEQLEKNPRN